MNNFSLITIGSCYYDDNNYIITFSSYKNKNQDEIFTIEYETLNSWNIEWIKNKQNCNELRKIISWLNTQGSEIKQMDDEFCLIGVNLHDINQHMITDTFNKIPYNIIYKFDYDIFNYIDIDPIKKHFDNKIGDIINKII
jgi:hypothetical protein